MKKEDIKVQKLMDVSMKMMELDLYMENLEKATKNLAELTSLVNSYRILIKKTKKDIEKGIIECGFNSIEEFENFKGFD